jgi:hypothetical protein
MRAAGAGVRVSLKPIFEERTASTRPAPLRPLTVATQRDGNPMAHCTAMENDQGTTRPWHFPPPLVTTALTVCNLPKASHRVKQFFSYFKLGHHPPTTALQKSQIPSVQYIRHDRPMAVKGLGFRRDARLGKAWRVHLSCVAAD